MRLSAVLGSVTAALVTLLVCHRPAPAAPPAPAEPGKPKVRLAVLVVFDQMRGDFAERWKPLFGKGGFARIQTDGVTFTRCYYPYGTTSTGPGHASMLSGTCPDRHGIANNNWYEKGQDVYCAGSTRYQIVPALAAPKGAKPKAAGTPERMTAETVADVLKATHPKAKVFGLSLKDRSAILPAGRRPDGAYWFDGRFVTSTYYAERVAPWVEEFNASKAADKWFGKEWARLRTDLDYAKYAGPDDAPGEGKGAEVKGKGDAPAWCQGVTFPHPMNPPGDKPTREYYESLANSPFGNDLLLEFAKACVVAEQLGADDVPDLLVVSFSSNDLVGHTWGPDSQEVLDVTLRSDAQMAELLSFLDAKVGKGRYLVGVTADHGICPLVEAETPYRKGAKAKRVDPRALQKAVEAHLTAKFGAPNDGTAEGQKKTPAWVEATSFPWVYLNPKVVAASGKTRGAVAEEAAAFLAKHADVGRAFTRADLAGTFPAEDVVANRCKRAFHPERCGDVYVVLKEWYLPSAALATGTTHGAPWDYDAHAPLMFFGPDVSGGTKDEPTTPQAMAAVFAKWLGLRNPEKAEFPIPAALGGK